jgi:hypothetical protein
MCTHDQMPLPDPASGYLRSRTWVAMSPSSVNQVPSVEESVAERDRVEAGGGREPLLELLVRTDVGRVAPRKGRELVDDRIGPRAPERGIYSLGIERGRDDSVGAQLLQGA